MKLYACIFAFLLAPFAQAQTITPDESTVILQAPKKIGINLNGPTYYQGGEIYKNLLWRNPGFEPDLYRDKFVAFKAGSSTTFPSPNTYDPVIANFWAGASFRLYRGSSPRTTVCSGTIAGNTIASGNAGPVYKFSSPCTSSVEEGDVIILRQAIACTPEAVWEDAGGGWWGSVAKGGKLMSECTAPFDGAQSLRMDASAAGSTAGVHGYIDTNPTDVGILFNGQYAVSGYYKTAGNPVLSVSARRLVTSATGNPLACATQTFAPAATWTSFTLTCTASETSSVAYGPVDVALSASGGVVLLDNISFQKTNTDPTNKTVFRDELLTTLKAHCAGASLTGVPCELRDWAFQNADEIANTVKPLFERSPTLAGANYDYPPNGGTGSNSVGLEEFLELCQAVAAEPYYTLPETTGPEDAANWMEYLNGSVSTPYGALRAAHGHAASWLSIFPTIHLPMGNENWNEGNTGQGLGYRSDAPDLYYDYSVDAAGVWAKMRTSPSWPAGGAGIDLVLGFQDGNADYGITEAWTRAQPNSGELAPYTQAYIGDVAPLTSLWNPLFFEAANNTTNPALTFFQQGSAIKTHGKLNVYEFDNGTSAGSSSLTQSVLDSFTDAAGYGTATALQGLQHLSFGIVDQNFFSLDQYAFNIPGFGFVHNWGAIIDMGGATNAVRPQELGMRMANAAIIGPMYACPVANPNTYNLAANHNGSDSSGMPATKNVPLEYAFCFKTGSQRSMIVINTDVTQPHSISFAGTQAPSGTVTLTRYAPASISATNEGTADGPTNNARQNVAINAPVTLLHPVADVLPPYSITRYDWTTNGTPALTPLSTSLSLASSSSTVTVGGSITLTATIAPAAASGSIVFKDGGAPVATAVLSKGSASVTVPAVSVGAHSFTAAYAGGSGYASSVSAAVTVTVQSALLVPTSTALAVSTTTPAGGSNLTATVSMNSSLVSGSVTLMDGAAKIATANLTAGRVSFTISSIVPGTHTYRAQYAGNSVDAASTSPVTTVVASRFATSVTLALSAASVAHVGSQVSLIATMGSPADNGTVTFKDGSATLGSATLSSGTATYLTPALTAGSHSYTAVYQGTTIYAASTSAPLTIVPIVVVPYLQTYFNEHAAGTHVDQTAPAVNNVKAVWSDPNGDWTYKQGGGIVTDTADLTNPLLIDTGHTDYTATFNVTGATGVRLLFRYTGPKNYLFVVIYATEVDLYSVSRGTTAKMATVYPASTSGPVSVTLAGSNATLSSGGKSASGTIPSNLHSTRIGVEPPAAGFTINSLSVTP